jgi:HSP20 family protein
MRIKKSEDKPEKDEQGLANREEWPWMMDQFGDRNRFANPFFRDFWRGLPEFRGHPLGSRWGPRWWNRSMALTTPATDLKDTGKEFVLKAEMPGVTKEDIDITVHGDSLEIRAERQSGKEEEHEGYYYREIGRNSFYRRIPLPEEVEAEKADGKLGNGVLELTLPKLRPTDVKAHKLKLQ